MLDWKEPELSDCEWISSLIRKSQNMGSDVSFANIYLLRKKYDIQICHYRGNLIRHYNGAYGRKGYSFPIGKGNIFNVLEQIEKDAKKRNEKLCFCFLTESQKAVLEEYYGTKIIFTNTQDDSDYIYLAKELSELAGKTFHKKKNHYSKFIRTYPNYFFSQIGAANIEDAIKVEEIWFREHLQKNDLAQQKEYDCIMEALEYFEELELTGEILYVNNTPSAMTIASCINEKVWDVHFEKVTDECAINGGYAAINKLFSTYLASEGAEYINREEDMGIEGLRKAKVSYRPNIILKKYNAEWSE